MKQNALTTFITIALLLCSHLSATAQSDVTDQYLTNAGFDNTADFVSSIVYTYANDANANGGVSSCQPVSHWAPDATGDAKAGGVFGFGSGYGLSGGGYVAPDADAEGNNSGGALGLATCWSASVGYSQPVTLPQGLFRISFMVYNAGTNIIANYSSTMGFIADDGTEHYADVDFYRGEWTEAVVYLNLPSATSGKIHLGYTCANVGSAASPKLFVDYVKIEQLPRGYMADDMTSLIDTGGWGGSGNYTAEGVTAREVFQWGASLPTGRQLGQQLTGLPDGLYSLTMLVGVSSTSGRDNVNNVLSEGSTAYASLHANDRQHGVPAYNREALSKFDRITLNDIAVSNGTLDIWLNQDQTGPNWLTLQVQSLKCVRPIPSELFYTIGDVNEDGAITIADVTALVNVILGKSNVGKEHLADINEDGSITIADVTALVNIILGKAEAKTVDLTWKYSKLDAMVYARQSAQENAAGAAYMLRKAVSTLTGADVSALYDMTDVVTTLNISTSLADVTSVSIFALDKTAIAGPMTVNRRGDELLYAYSAGDATSYASSQESDVVSVRADGAEGTYTAYLRPVSLQQGVKVTIQTADGRFYSQDFTDIAVDRPNALTFTQTIAQNLWQSTIPGNVPFTFLSLPGAHDAATKGMAANTTECQSLSIGELLASGVRSLDLRPYATSSTTADNMYIYHGSSRSNVLFKTALSDVVSFLSAHPSETVFILMHEEDDNSLDAWRSAVLACLQNVADHIKVIDNNMTLDDCRGKMVVISRDNVAATNLCGKCGWGSSFNPKTVFRGSDSNGTTPWTLYYQDEYAYSSDYASSRIANIEKLLTDHIVPNETNPNFIYVNTTNVAYGILNYGSYIRTTAPVVNQAILDSQVFTNSTGRWGIVSSDYMADSAYKGDLLLRAIVNQNYKYVFKGRSRVE